LYRDGVLEYICHCFASLVDELGVFIADEEVRRGFSFVLEAAELVSDDFGICAERACSC
jgi:hypothetical protein